MSYYKLLYPTVRCVLELGLPPYLFLESCQQISVYLPWSIPFCCGLKVNCFLGRLWNLLVIDPSWGGPGDLGMQLEAYRIALLVPVEIQEVTPQDFIRRDEPQLSCLPTLMNCIPRAKTTLSTLCPSVVILSC